MRASKSGTPVKVVTNWLEIDWQCANKNCYRLLRISWALAQISRCLYVDTSGVLPWSGGHSTSMSYRRFLCQRSTVWLCWHLQDSSRWRRTLGSPVVCAIHRVTATLSAVYRRRPVHVKQTANAWCDVHRAGLALRAGATVLWVRHREGTCRQEISPHLTAH